MTGIAGVRQSENGGSCRIVVLTGSLRPGSVTQQTATAALHSAQSHARR